MPRELFPRLQAYDPPAADLPESDLEEIEDVDKVEPKMAMLSHRGRVM